MPTGILFSVCLAVRLSYFFVPVAQLEIFTPTYTHHMKALHGEQVYGAGVVTVSSVGRALVWSFSYALLDPGSSLSQCLLHLSLDHLR